MTSRVKRRAEDDATATATLSTSSQTQLPNKRARQRELKRVAHRISTQDTTQFLDPRYARKEVQLPGQIQVDRYVESYSYEIKALQNAIKGSSTGTSIRAWQMLPRHQRRRNASHSLLALPKRLREKGRAELKASKTESKSRSEMRRSKGKGDRSALGAYPRRKESSRRRELIERASKAALQGTAWLETHLWHAKRFRMSGLTGKRIDGKVLPLPERWGFTLAEESSMKSHRSTWRDQKRHVTLMDVSYHSWVRISISIGVEKDDTKLSQMMSSLLQRAGLANGWQKEWWDGKHCCYTILSTNNKNYNKEKGEALVDTANHSALGPVQMLWVKEDQEILGKQRKRVEVLLGTHPAAASSLQRALRLGLIFTSREIEAKVKITGLNSVPHPLITVGNGLIGRIHSKDTSETRSQNKSANIIDEALQRRWMRSEAYNTFQISGLESGQLLNKVLRPINNEDGRKMEAIRQGKVEKGAVIPLEVHDPRLSFPPKRPRTLRPADQRKTAVQSADKADWDASSKLLYLGCPLPTFRKGEIDRRRSKLVTPGSRLLPTSKDDIVSIVVIAANNQPGFILLVPRGWGQAFWLSLVYPGTRIIGQVQLHALNFDAGRSTFPVDWVGTSSFQKHEDAESLIASEEWARRPSSKRANFEKTNIIWPFGGTGLWRSVANRGRAISGVPCVDPKKDKKLPWLYNSTSSKSITELLELYRQCCDYQNREAQQSLSAFGSAVICVKVTACRKGSFNHWDEIHILEEFTAKEWTNALLNLQKDGRDKEKVQQLERGSPPSSHTHIGSITTANFNLSSGKATALASISLLAFLQIISTQTSKISSQETLSSRNPILLDNLVLVKNTQNGTYRVANVEIAPLI